VRRSVRAPERVHLLGAVSRARMLHEMVDADLMLFASLGDTFGLVVTEAKLCRLPIVALADDAGVSAQVTDGEVGGYLAADREEFVSRVHHALANPEEAAQVAERGARDVAERFGPAEYGRLAAILQRAAAARPSRAHRVTTLAVARLVRLLCWTLPRAFIRMYDLA
jgi:glycosyltransferase involved in cell wall biosynthesis